MVYTIDMPITRAMGDVERKNIVKQAIDNCVFFGVSVRFSKDYSVYKSGMELVLEAYGCNPYRISISDHTIEELVNHIRAAFHI